MQDDSPESATIKRKNDKKPAKKLPKRLSERYLRNSALYYLQRHPTSVSNFIAVMSRKIDRSVKVYPEQDGDVFKKFISDVLAAEFEKAGFLNDSLYAQGLSLSLARRGMPARTIQNKLRMKGIQDVPETLNDYNDLAAGLRFAKRKRLGLFARPDKERDPQKELGVMARNGFSYDIVSKVLAMDFDEAQEILRDTDI